MTSLPERFAADPRVEPGLPDASVIERESRLVSELIAPAVYVRTVPELVKTTEGLVPCDPRLAVLDGVSLNRKKSRSLSLTAWSKRTLTESSELGFDQLAR